MIIDRRITGHLKKMLEKFPVVSLTGPRQSGKTTLLRTAFPDYRYYNLERPDTREIILLDIMGFLKNAGTHVIFDEAQNMPELFSYIQVVSDERKSAGQYILSGSQSFLLNNHINQTLAGRVSINNLMPFDINEIIPTWKLTPEELILNGFYPRLYDQKINPDDFYPSYLQTYIERDIRTLKSVENLRTFSHFLGLCAGRTGQIINLTSLANDTGISVNTAKSWLSLLEASFIVFLLQPYYRNFNKRLIKSPKLYFYDTGIASSLLRISDIEMLRTHFLSGALFENLVISEIIKSQVHLGKRPSVYYWKESNGSEIDCILEGNKRSLILIEIKAGQTFSDSYLRNLRLFPSDSMENPTMKMVVYGGDDSFKAGDIQIVSWGEFVKYLSGIC